MYSHQSRFANIEIKTFKIYLYDLVPHMNNIIRLQMDKIKYLPTYLFPYPTKYFYFIAASFLASTQYNRIRPESPRGGQKENACERKI